MQAVITCIAASTIHYSMPSEEKNILCNLQVYNPYTVSFQKKIRIQWHSDTVWILFSLNLRQIVWLYFFHMVPELDEEAFRNRKEDLDQDSL